MSLLSHTRGALLAVTLAPLAAGRGAQPSWTDLAQRDLAATQFIAASFFGPAAAGAQQADRQVDNLRAFARLYGYVRFFHPSDEAASIDWDRFAVLGAQRVKDAGTTDNLLARLGAFFRPIAPSVVLYREGTAPPADRHVPTDTAGLQMVAWQHQGALIAPSRPNAYWSLRTNRAAIMAVPAPAFASLTQAVDATPYRGRRVRLRAHISARVQGAGNQAQMWLRVDREGSGTAFIDNMSNRPVMHAEWREYEVVAPVDSASSRIHFGALLLGMGEGRWDSFELAVEGEGGRWIPVPIADGGFEAADSTWSRVTTQNPTRPDFDNRWSAASAGFDYGVTTSGAAAGAHAAFIRRRVQSRTHPLFDVRPARGEVLDVSLGSGLRARVPVALFSDGSGTHPRSDATALASLTSAAGAVDVSRAAAESPDAWLGGVVIAWNVLQHFYPYFDVVRVDWPAELDRALKQALADRSGREFQVTLRRLMAALDDGHAGVSHPDHATTGVVPWLVEWVVGQAIVTASADTSARRGDIVVAVDDVRTADLIAQAEQVISGSPQWKRVRAVSELGAGVRGTAARVMLARDGRELEVQLARTAGPFPREFDRAPIVELEPGIRYVDLTRAPWTDINAALPALAAAEGVIIDLRGYPNSNHYILHHLLPQPDTSVAWMRIPQYIYPDQQRQAGYRNAGWSMEARQPRIRGRVAFLTDARAISYSESVMGLVEHYKLGAIVGQMTAGANGNVNPLSLPGGYEVRFTGMRVVKHDGSQHHIVGIRPTVPATRTIAGVRAGRDEVLEAALEVVRGRR